MVLDDRTQPLFALSMLQISRMMALISNKYENLFFFQLNNIAAYMSQTDGSFNVRYKNMHLEKGVNIYLYKH